MKNYGKLVPIALVLLLAGAWYSIISTVTSENGTYQKYVDSARNRAEVKVTKYALKDYQSALQEKNTPELYQEVADYLIENEDPDDVIEWCEAFYEEYPDLPVSTEYLLNAYLAEDDFKSCFGILEAAQARNVTSETIDEISNSIKYAYELDFNNYEDVGVFGANLCPVKIDGQWGYVNRYGDQKIGNSFSEASCFTTEGFAAVVDKSGLPYFIDQEGDKAAAAKEEYVSFGNLAGNRTTGVKKDKSVVILDENLHAVADGFEFVSTYQGDRALSKSDGKWSIIDGQGNKVSNTVYTDVILDEKNIAMRSDRMFVSEGDHYILADAAGKKISNQTFDSAKVFGPDGFAAVRKNGKWFFIDTDGNNISGHTYDDARSFYNGLAAVKIGDKWGFVDENEDIVIKPEFIEAKDFTEKGSCFVKTGETWQMLRIYRLNRRD